MKINELWEHLLSKFRGDDKSPENDTDTDPEAGQAVELVAEEAPEPVPERKTSDEVIIRMADSTCEVTQYEQPECARIQRKTEDGMIQTDLYLMSEKWIHHITLIYPQDRQEKYDTCIEYMIHSITSDETDLG